MINISSIFLAHSLSRLMSVAEISKYLTIIPNKNSQLHVYMPSLYKIYTSSLPVPLHTLFCPLFVPNCFVSSSFRNDVLQLVIGSGKIMVSKENIFLHMTKKSFVKFTSWLTPDVFHNSNLNFIVRKSA